MRIQSPAVKDDLYRRLRRIEGQSRGVQRMLEEDRECHEIMQQLKAIQSAVRNASALFIRAYAKDCLNNADGFVDHERIIDEVVDIMS